MTIDPATKPEKMSRIERLMTVLEKTSNHPTAEAPDVVAKAARDARQLILDLLGMSDLPLGERLAQRHLAIVSAENPSEGTADELRNLVRFCERWIPDALPANEVGQVHFARALNESLVASVKMHLAKEHGDADASAGE